MQQFPSQAPGGFPGVAQTNFQAARQDDDDIIDLRQYFRILNQHKWGILGLGLSVAVLTLLVVFAMTPIYTATATLLIEAEEASVVSIQEVYGLASPNDQYFQTQFEILKSRRLAERVIERLGMMDHPEFKPDPTAFNWRQMFPFSLVFGGGEAPTEYSIQQRAVNQFASQLTIAPVRGTQLTHISFESSDRELAAAVVNSLAQIYIDANLEAKLEVTMQASNWLTERLGGLREDLGLAEARLQNFRESEGLVGADGGTVLANRELDLVQERLLDTRRERLQLESAINQLRQFDGEDLESLQRIPVVLNHVLVRDYFTTARAAEQRVAELSERYGYRHPTMISAQRELESAQAQLQRQVSAVVGTIRTEYEIAQSNERSVEAQLASTRSDVQDLSRKEFELRELEKDVETKRSIYDTFFTRLSETSATGDLSTANARLADPAVVPLRPSAPRKGLITAVAFVLALMMGVVLAFLADMLDNTIKSPQDIEQRLGTSLLGILPMLPEARKDPDGKLAYAWFLKHNKSNYAEAVRTIRTSLLLSNLDNPPKLIAVTSTVPGEGKTSTSLNIAFALAQMEKVLLIDADMRRPSIAKALGIDSRHPGIANVAAGTAELADAIVRYEAGGLDVITAGVVPPNPLELLSSKRFAAVLQVLSTKYDRIIIDTAPCGAVSDALALAPRVAAMIYVVRADSTSGTLVEQAFKRLRESRAPISGVVLNQVDLSKKNTYYGEYYSGYYNYSGYGTEEPKKA